MEFFNKIKHVRSYSIYKHDTTLNMAFGANFILANFNTGPPIVNRFVEITQNTNKTQLLASNYGTF